MKKLLTFGIIFLFLTSIQAQTKTIKVVKKKPTLPSTVIPPSPAPLPSPGGYFYLNDGYLFKGKDAWAIEFGFNVLPRPSFSYGLSCLGIIRPFDASGYAMNSSEPEKLLKNSQVRLLYVNLPLAYRIPMGARSLLQIGLAPSYLASVTNSDKRFSISDFHAFNANYFLSAGRNFSLHRKYYEPYFIGIWFSGQILPALKDEDIRDNTGQVLYKQNSRTYVLGLQLIYFWGRRGMPIP
jgi:hypothetical protein